MEKNKKKYLLFDLDGTLTDPKIGICTCVQYALKSFGIDEPDLDKLEPFIGPPLKESFMNFYQMDEQQAQAAVDKYRERFQDVGLFENEVYPGIPRMLKALNDRGMTLAVASSKPTVFVERILEHFKIRQYFKVVVGSELDGRRVNKDEVVAEVLHQFFGEKRIERDKIYMIGDRKFDVEGARALGIESVGVTYGYGGMDELWEAKADYIVRSVEELKDFLLRETIEDAPRGLTLRRVWQFGLPFLSFLIVRQLVVNLCFVLFVAINGRLFGVDLLLYEEANQAAGFTGNGYALSQILGFMAGIAINWHFGWFVVKKQGESDRLLHLKKEPVKNYFYLGFATLLIMIGLNLMLALSGWMQSSTGYQETAAVQRTPSLIMALILYVLVAPLAEELLFRGIIYNCLKRAMLGLPAMVLAAAFFGIYHGNSVQGIYGFLMALLMLYAYEYFGDFKVPVIMHMGINLISYLMGYIPFDGNNMVGWIVCGFSLGTGVIFLFLMARQKKVLRTKW